MLTSQSIDGFNLFEIINFNTDDVLSLSASLEISNQVGEAIFIGFFHELIYKWSIMASYSNLTVENYIIISGLSKFNIGFGYYAQDF